MIILKRAGRPGQQVVVFFFSKVDCTRAQLSQNNSNAKDNDQQDVSHLAFFPNSPRFIRLFIFRTFIFGTIFVDVAFWCFKN